MAYFFDELDFLSSNSTYWNKVKNRLEKVTGGRRRFLGRGSGDFFYIPHSLFNDTLPMLQLLGKHRIYLEIAALNALRPASTTFHRVDLQAHDFGMGHIRCHPFEKVYSTSLEYIHPFKLGNVKTYFLGIFQGFIQVLHVLSSGHS